MENSPTRKKNEKGRGLASSIYGQAFYSNYSRNQNNAEERFEITDEFKPSLTEQEKSDIIKSIKINKEGNSLTFITFLKIRVSGIKIAMPGFIKLTQKHRESRRAYLKDLQKYLEAWRKYSQELDELIDKAEKEILNVHDISQSLWDETNKKYHPKENKQLDMLYNALGDRFKTALPVTKQISKQDFENIIKSQIIALENEKVALKQLGAYTNNQEEKISIIENRINDRIFQEQGVEEEDILAFIKDHEKEEDVYKQLWKYNDEFDKLINPNQGRNSMKELDPLIKLKKDNIIAKIHVEKDGDFVSINTILQVIDAIVEVAAIDYVDLIKRDRERKRANFDNLKKYVELWEKNIDNVEHLIDDTRKMILKRLNIENTLWDNSNTFHVKENNYQLYMIHATIPERLKSSIPPSIKLSKKDFKKILLGQINAYEIEGHTINELTGHLNNAEEVGAIIQSRVNDIIYIKYGIEEEDTLPAITVIEYEKDQEIQDLFHQLQDTMIKVIP